MCGPTIGTSAIPRETIVLEDDWLDGDTNKAVLSHIYNFTYADIRQPWPYEGTERYMEVFLTARK